MSQPTDQDALRAVHAGLGMGVRSVERLAVGLRHYVYAITTDEGREVVARLATSDSADELAGGVYWHERLRGVGVPLADLLHVDLTPASGFPFMLLARLPGRDLGLVYDDLTRAQRFAIAERIVAVQRAVATLPSAHGFGFARSYDDLSLHNVWLDVVLAEVERSRQRIAISGAVSVQLAERVRERVLSIADQLRAVEPVAFLDDTTTKNVLIARGNVKGIVDTDNVCFGDSLFTLALTRVALLAHGHDPEYATHWQGLLALSEEQTHALDVYTAVFLLGFLSELGHHFNQDAPIASGGAYQERLEALLAQSLERA